MRNFLEMLSPLMTTTTMVFMLSIAASASAGYLYGSRASLNAVPASLTPEMQTKKDNTDPLADPDEEEDETEENSDGDLAAITTGFLEPCKLVLVVRNDLGMSPGKIAAQCSHATLACYKSLVKKNPKLVHHWERTGQAKIALKCSSEMQLQELEAIAKSLNLCARSIQDAGRTEVEAGTTTVLGIGPAPVELVNQVTGKLRLL